MLFSIVEPISGSTIIVILLKGSQAQGSWQLRPSTSTRFLFAILLRVSLSALQ